MAHPPPLPPPPPPPPPLQPKDTRPNFLIIVADDLGFSDISCYGSEIHTPNIDSLCSPSPDNNGSTDSTTGIRFTSFHVAAACSPTRSMLMTGTDHHIAGLGQLAEFVRNSPAHQGKPGHEGYLNERVVALPELLKEGGYATFMSGKWHLGAQPEHWPKARGFDRSFTLLPGCANHYGYEPRFKVPEKGPARWYEVPANPIHVEDSSYVPTLPEGFYSSDYYVTKLISYLSDRTPEQKAQPFFAYLPFSAPHWPLQAPKESMDKYRGVYDEGPDVLREKRIKRLKEMGLVPEWVVPHEMVIAPKVDPPEWTKMSDHERLLSARKMEAYAGMVDRMDFNIGRILSYLKSTDPDAFDNTFIYFLSDNGAAGASVEGNPVFGDEIKEHIKQYYDNSAENIGRGNSFVWYGARWAQAGTAPARLYKMFSTEGGCRVPLIVKPARAAVAKGVEAKAAVPATGDVNEEGKTEGPNKTYTGPITDAFCTVMDFVPTILEYAGLQHPGTQWKGREIAPVKGISWKPFFDAVAEGSLTLTSAPPAQLLTQTQNQNPPHIPTPIHPPTHTTGWELAGCGALRKGNYKITYVPLPRGPQRWELFDLEKDPGETRDISLEEPVVFGEMLGLWEEYRREVGVVGLVGEEGWGKGQLKEGKGEVVVVKEVKDEFEEGEEEAKVMEASG